MRASSRTALSRPGDPEAKGDQQREQRHRHMPAQPHEEIKQRCLHGVLTLRPDRAASSMIWIVRSR